MFYTISYALNALASCIEESVAIRAGIVNRPECGCIKFGGRRKLKGERRKQSLPFAFLDLKAAPHGLGRYGYGRLAF